MAKKIKERKFTSPTKQKVLLLLQAGLILSLTPSPRRQFWILKQLSKEWKKIDRQYLYRIIREFKYERLVNWKEKEDGSIEVVLTEKGKKHALKFNFEEIKIKEPAVWDNKWRLVFYDIPEKKKKAREALREKLKKLGFYELQKSVFVHPFKCKDEIDFIIECFEIRNFVRYGEIENLSNESEIKLHFNLY
ncbi:CRISPR-associated endonuclease Cas2 [Patescibacteria group bacterium]|nr:CRISPR-associated endonuclease Cas2 [Patescibacteria group bacterium]